MASTDRRSLRTKRNIREAFLELIQIKELRKITITELADKADIDRKTFYLHYESISGILVEIGNDIEKELYDIIKNNQESFSVKKIILDLNSIMIRDLEFYKLITKEESYLVLKNRFKDILKNAIKNTFYNDQTISELEFLFYAEYMSSGVIGIYTDWLNSPNDITIDQLTIMIENAVSNSWNHIITE